jgi:hypothetical protein
VAWRLAIHHIDVIGSGDATLIIAREVPPLIGAMAIIRSALIDGGRRQYSGGLHTYVGARLGPGVQTAAGGIVGPIGGLGIDPRNEKSLAVEVTFGNFRYYVGGDIETAQENSIQLLLNNTGDAAGRVLAMKTSHHGANTATARGFVDQLRPSAAFISCGTAWLAAGNAANGVIPPGPPATTMARQRDHDAPMNGPCSPLENG